MTHVLASERPARFRSFLVVLLIELWERFGYYGMQAVLLLYMVQRLGFPDSRSSLLWGAFAALTYASPAIGGWVGDQILGSRRTMLAGAATLMVGYALLAAPQSGTGQLYAAMAVIAVGNGLFKSNASNLVRRIYADDDAQLDAAFTLYYMAVNVGSTVSILLCPWLKDAFGWPAAFGVCALGLALGLLNYGLMHRRLAHIGSEPDARPLSVRHVGLVALGALAAMVAVAFVLQHPAVARACVYLAGLVVVAIWAIFFRRAAPRERAGLAVLYILTFETMLYFIFYQQQATSLTLFALRNVSGDFTLFGTTLWHFSAGQFQALNPIWIMLASPPLAWTYTRLARGGHTVTLATKFAIGMALVTCGFLIWWLSCLWSRTPLVSPWVMVAGYGAISVGELMVSGLGLAAAARYAPARVSAFMMGAYFTAVGISMYLGSWVATLASVPQTDVPDPAATLPIYGALFEHLFWFGVVCTAICIVLLPLTRVLDRRFLIRPEADFAPAPLPDAA
ncbi:POT family proton-dependent oligopeptide transporter [Endobacter medicaginis]|jgi:proton-dependent oligopeptide transporter, POT family|uniref:MFS transporter n=1 Tax=Endobacter medicaginis TaxID=1181271 RepID=A0A839V172_9PROT|nr:oligopeptide:H+ symporter [Endobacter medicaginis]MBB3174585.1 POT family proton-dependent oligopeptide transporter [Endobacter medicaginis]MCX5474723.1 oligopeptide:H+ symporter [Endobacter medicaginis]NVN30283.1 MFS transporter [Endobacter medicaginis]